MVLPAFCFHLSCHKQTATCRNTDARVGNSYSHTTSRHQRLINGHDPIHFNKTVPLAISAKTPLKRFDSPSRQMITLPISKISTGAILPHGQFQKKFSAPSNTPPPSAAVSPAWVNLSHCPRAARRLDRAAVLTVPARVACAVLRIATFFEIYSVRRWRRSRADQCSLHRRI